MTMTWYPDRKRLTAEQVQAMTFPAARFGKRGYDEDHVDAFLRQVEQELILLLNEKTSLWNEVERLRRRITAGKTANGDPVLFGKDDAHVHAVHILASAQLTADRYVADAQAYSQKITEEARSRRDQILNQAQQHADLVLDEATTRAREAALHALNSAPPQAEASRTALHAELAYLRAFGEVYRTHLRAYTEGMLRSIDEWERKEAASRQEIEQSAPMVEAPALDGHPYAR
jgi:DivIVA domain-containing protein